ncbi:hypothetical protein HPP92_015694 [Vanilla planifolia]|uniref:Uncharacterized protein n=1 Tax=Vanilla planifolia TaxID=51239 RepID=A0A835QGR2_VANPL|nr:hypothetical protein HPP92_015694 [Vanilla planifolia]
MSIYLKQVLVEYGFDGLEWGHHFSDFPSLKFGSKSFCTCQWMWLMIVKYGKNCGQIMRECGQPKATQREEGDTGWRDNNWQSLGHPNLV